jgi:hypothetical protein
MEKNLSRRDFLKLVVTGAGTSAMRPFRNTDLLQFPDTEILGHITVGKIDV